MNILSGAGPIHYANFFLTFISCCFNELAKISRLQGLDNFFHARVTTRSEARFKKFLHAVR